MPILSSFYSLVNVVFIFIIFLFKFTNFIVLFSAKFTSKWKKAGNVKTVIFITKELKNMKTANWIPIQKVINFMEKLTNE